MAGGRMAGGRMMTRSNPRNGMRVTDAGPGRRGTAVCGLVLAAATSACVGSGDEPPESPTITIQTFPEEPPYGSPRQPSGTRIGGHTSSTRWSVRSATGSTRPSANSPRSSRRCHRRCRSARSTSRRRTTDHSVANRGGTGRIDRVRLRSDEFAVQRGADRHHIRRGQGVEPERSRAVCQTGLACARRAQRTASRRPSLRASPSGTGVADHLTGVLHFAGIGVRTGVLDAATCAGYALIAADRRIARIAL